MTHGKRGVALRQESENMTREAVVTIVDGDGLHLARVPETVTETVPDVETEIARSRNGGVQDPLLALRRVARRIPEDTSGGRINIGNGGAGAGATVAIETGRRGSARVRRTRRHV